MNNPTWRKSSYSGSNGGECIEVGSDEGHLLVRDTKDREGPMLRVSPAAWRRFAAQVKSVRLLAAHPRGASRPRHGALSYSEVPLAGAWTCFPAGLPQV